MSKPPRIGLGLLDDSGRDGIVGGGGPGGGGGGRRGRGGGGADRIFCTNDGLSRFSPMTFPCNRERNSAPGGGGGRGRCRAAPTASCSAASISSALGKASPNLPRPCNFDETFVTHRAVEVHS